MSNLREMIDGTGNLKLNVPVAKQSNHFRAEQDVVIRRPTGRSGPATSQIQVGKILAIGNSMATVSIAGPQGSKSQQQVHVRDLAPATPEFKRRSIQFSPQYRKGW